MLARAPIRTAPLDVFWSGRRLTLIPESDEPLVLLFCFLKKRERSERERESASGREKKKIYIVVERATGNCGYCEIWDPLPRRVIDCSNCRPLCSLWQFLHGNQVSSTPSTPSADCLLSPNVKYIYILLSVPSLPSPLLPIQIAALYCLHGNSHKLITLGDLVCFTFEREQVHLNSWEPGDVINDVMPFSNQLDCSGHLKAGLLK